MQIKRRLNKAYKSLLDRNIVEDYTGLAEMLKMNTSTVRGAFSYGSPYLSYRFLDRFMKVFGDQFSKEWLYDGIGAMRARVDVTPDETREERWKRVAYIVNHERLSVQDFAKEIGLTHPSTIYRALQNKTRPNDQTLELIHQRFPQYNREWLFKGRGEIYNLPVTEASYKGAAPYQIVETMEFPIVPDAASAGRLSNYGDFDPNSLASMIVPVERRYKGHYYIFTVRGISMDDGTTDALCDGDKILCREVARNYWSDGLHRRSWPYFVFATLTEGIIVKQVIDQDLVADTITCHSLNPAYPDIVLHLKDIVGIYNVVELVSRSMKR